VKRLIRGLVHRGRALLGRNRAAVELDEEIRYHIQLDIAKNIQAGMTPAEARRQAMLRFGNIENTKEEVRDESGVRWIEDLLSDASFALRSLRKTPVFAAAALISLGVGIGANTAIFSVVNGVLLQPLPYPNANRLYSAAVAYPDFSAPLSEADFRLISEMEENSASLAAYNNQGFTLTTPDGPEIVTGAWVTPTIFDVLDVSPIVGRRFTLDDEQAVIVSYEFWQSRLSGSTDALTQTLELDGGVYSIIGVLPPGFLLPTETRGEIYPLSHIDEPPRRGPFFLRAFLRLSDGVTPEIFQQQLSGVAERTKSMYPGGSVDWHYGIRPLKEAVIGNVSRMLLLLFAAVGCVLLIAIANVANLQLARGAARQGEVALRFALGAKRGRLVRQMLTESAALGTLGAFLGIALAWAGVEVLATAAASFVPRMDSVGVDRWVLGFALSAGLISGAIVGIAPALSVPWHSLNRELTVSGRGGSIGATRGTLRKTLVVAEFALALTVLLASGLLVKSLLRLQSADLGFDDEGIVAFRLSLPSDPYESREEFDEFLSTLEQRLVALPGVSHVGYATSLPPDRLSMTNNYTVEGDEPEPGGAQPVCPWLTSDEGYFRTMGIPLLQGRTFDGTDRNGERGAVVVSAEFARFHFPGESAVGKRLQGGAWSPEMPWLTIVGVVGDVPYAGLREGVHRTVYMSYRQANRWRVPWVVVRVSAEFETLMPQIRNKVHSLDARAPIHGIATMHQLVRASTTTGRSLSILFSVLAAVALVLAATGIYGVISYHVTSQRREFAIRQALGAPGAGVVRGVLKEGLVLAVAGVAFGLGGAYWLARGMSSLLFEITPADMTTYVGTALALTATAIVACVVPSLRASRVDPVSALRED
jgi:predicted permease